MSIITRIGDAVLGRASSVAKQAVEHGAQAATPRVGLPASRVGTAYVPGSRDAVQFIDLHQVVRDLDARISKLAGSGATPELQQLRKQRLAIVQGMRHKAATAGQAAPAPRRVPPAATHRPPSIDPNPTGIHKLPARPATTPPRVGTPDQHGLTPVHERLRAMRSDQRFARPGDAPTQVIRQRP